MFLIWDTVSNFSRVVFMEPEHHLQPIATSSTQTTSPSSLLQKLRWQQQQQPETSNHDDDDQPQAEDDDVNSPSGFKSSSSASAANSDVDDEEVEEEFMEIGFISHHLLTEQLKVIARHVNRETLTVMYETHANVGDPPTHFGSHSLQCTFTFRDPKDFDDFLAKVERAKAKLKVPRNVSLNALLDAGFIRSGDLLHLTYRGHSWEGKILKSGHIVELNSNREFGSLSGFSLTMKRTVNSSLKSDNGWLSLRIIDSIWQTLRHVISSRDAPTNLTQPVDDDEDIQWSVSSSPSSKSEKSVETTHSMSDIREQYVSKKRLCQLIRESIHLKATRFTRFTRGE